MTRFPAPTTRAATPRRPGRGFTFVEVLVVMALAAMLLGLSIGALTSVGRAGLAQQGAEIVAEAGRRCLNMSAGNKRAILDLRETDVEGTKRIEVQTAVQRNVLTSNFEAEPDWFIFANEPGTARTSGAARIDPDGKTGSCAVLGQGAVVEYGTRSAFAMTDGLEIEAWVKPDAAGRSMTVLKADDEGATVWQLDLLAAPGRTGAFDVKLHVKEVPADARESLPGAGRDYLTSGAPVGAGRWSKIRASFDGRDGSLQVDNVERAKVDRGGRAVPAGKRTSRLWVPPSGTVRLSTGPSYIGALDTLTVAGMFRSDEDVRRLPLGVDPYRMVLPVHVVFLNGRLDPAVHKADVEIRLKGPADSETAGFTSVRYGLYGSITAPTYRTGTP